MSSKYTPQFAKTVPFHKVNIRSCKQPRQFQSRFLVPLPPKSLHLSPVGTWQHLLSLKTGCVAAGDVLDHTAETASEAGAETKQGLAKDVQFEKSCQLSERSSGQARCARSFREDREGKKRWEGRQLRSSGVATCLR